MHCVQHELEDVRELVGEGLVVEHLVEGVRRREKV